MIKRIKIQWFKAVFAALCTIAASSCKQVEPAVIAEVSVKSSEVSAAEGSLWVSVVCSGEWQLSLRGVTEDVDWAELAVTHGRGNKSNVGLKYEENTKDEPRTLEIVITCGEQWSSCPVTQLASGNLPGDGGSSDGSQDAPATDVAKHKWLELPSMEDDELEYFCHSFQMDGNTYRNYSFGWSQKDRVAVWVAYPLCKFYTNGSVKREQAEVWALDPLLGDLSSEPRGDYGARYDRGHQLPFADRKCCLEAARQTFYGTNMTPQHPTLNQKGWANFEEIVRGWAETSDTTYVVTGCVVDPCNEYTVDGAGNKMTVPSAYFKAVLKYSTSSTLGQ